MEKVGLKVRATQMARRVAARPGQALRSLGGVPLTSHRVWDLVGHMPSQGCLP